MKEVRVLRAVVTRRFIIELAGLSYIVCVLPSSGLFGLVGTHLAHKLKELVSDV